MLSRKFFYGLLAVGVLTGCSDKKDEDGGMEEPKGDMEVMTPTQSKEYLQNTATEVLDLFKPADQKDIIALAAFLRRNMRNMNFLKISISEMKKSSILLLPAFLIIISRLLDRPPAEIWML